MKKIIFALAINCSLFISAQNNPDSNINVISFGVKGGLNISNVTDQSVNYSFINQNSKVGFNAGVFVNIPINKSFSIQPELLFSQYGYKSEYDFSLIMTEDGYDPLLVGNKAKNTTNLGYIVIPIMLQYNIIPNLYVEAGSEFGINIFAQEKYTETNNSYSQNRTMDIDKNIKKFNFGLGAGAGYYFTENIGITARYIFGLTNTDKNPYNLPNKTAIKNKVFQVGLAYKF